MDTVGPGQTNIPAVLGLQICKPCKHTITHRFLSSQALTRPPIFVVVSILKKARLLSISVVMTCLISLAVELLNL